MSARTLDQWLEWQTVLHDKSIDLGLERVFALTYQVEFFEKLSDRTLTSLFLLFARLATWQRSFNVIVTNVPGPQFPVYLVGARMLEIYPLVPLATNQALGIALFSYDGGLYWGFNADWDALPDLHDLVIGVEEEFQVLHGAAFENAPGNQRGEKTPG